MRWLALASSLCMAPACAPPPSLAQLVRPGVERGDCDPPRYTRAGPTLVCVDICRSSEFYELLDGEWIPARDPPFRFSIPAYLDGTYPCAIPMSTYCQEHPWCNLVRPDASPEQSLPPLPRTER